MREGGQSFLKNFEKKNEKKLAKFFEMLPDEETKLYLGRVCTRSLLFLHDE